MGNQQQYYNYLSFYATILSEICYNYIKESG
nr:MAG TPA: hypothetical protein [Caudoviricetes sp.]